MWLNTAIDEEMVGINEQMEALIEEMANTRSVHLLNRLNNYPIIPVHAHVRPFHTWWLNLLCGLCIPVGIFFYVRIWIFRIRLSKDLERIIATNNEIIQLIPQLDKNNN